MNLLRRFRRPPVVDDQHDVFLKVLDRTKIRIHGTSGMFDRDMRTAPWSEGIKYYGKGSLPWYSALIRCTDSDVSTYVGCKSEIYYPMFYALHNTNADSNHWGDVPILVVDCCLAGSYPKDVVVDGKIVCSYAPGGKAFFWIHYNLASGEVGVF